MAAFKTITYIFIKAVSILLTAALIAVCLFFGFIYYCNLAGKDVPTLGPYQMYVVLSDSMRPLIHANDAVVVKNTDVDTLKVNDIITFYAFENNVIITHRIIGAEQTAQGREFRTKGDFNNVEDSFTTPGDRVIGKYVTKIPKLASFLTIAMQRPYFIAIVVAAVILLQVLFGWAEKALLPETEKTGETASREGAQGVSHTLPEQATELAKQNKEEEGTGHEEDKPQNS